MYKYQVTKEEMGMYESIRNSGLTNMFDVKAVIKLSNYLLTKEAIVAIMKDYSGWMETHKIERKS